MKYAIILSSTSRLTNKLPGFCSAFPNVHRKNMTQSLHINHNWLIIMVLIVSVLLLYAFSIEQSYCQECVFILGLESISSTQTLSDADLKDLHPYFRGRPIEIIEMVPDLQINGYRIPLTFRYRLEDPASFIPSNQKHMDEQGAPPWAVGTETKDASVWPTQPIRFILIKPGKCTVDGLSFDVDRPFYISQTVISNSQAFMILGSSPHNDAELDRFFKTGEKRLLFAGLPTNDPVQDHVRKYIRDPNKPYLVVAAEEADEIVAHFHTRRYMSLPTLGQFFLAMRAGRQSRYWWGDAWNRSPITQEYWEGNDPKAMYAGIKNVDRGEKNPIGLYNMCYNVSQIVMPSDAETMTLRKHYETITNRDWNMSSSCWRGAHYALGSSCMYSAATSESLGFSLDDVTKSGVGGDSCFHTPCGIRLVFELPCN